MSDIKISIGADIKDLQTKLAQAGGVTQEFAKKTTTNVDNAAGAFTRLANSGQKSLFILNEKLKELQSAAFTEKDIAKISNYNKEIAATKNEITKLSTVGTQSMGALGNAGQKAFGAVRQLAYVLPGIGIAGIFSVITEALIKAATATAALSYQQELLNSIYEKAAKGASEQVAKIDILSSKITDLSISQKDRIKYVKEYNDIADQSNKIDEKEINNLDLINQKLSTQIQLIEARALAKAAEAKIAEQAQKVIEAEFNVKQFEKFKDARALNTEEINSAYKKEQSLQQDNLSKNKQTNSDNLAQKSNYLANVSVLNDKALAGQKKYNQALVTLNKERAELERQIGIISPLINPDSFSKPIKPDKVTIKPNKVSIDIKDSRMDEPKMLSNQLEAKLQERGKELSITIRPSVHFDTDLAQVEKGAIELSSTIQSILDNSLSSISNALQNSIEGKGNFFGNFFGGLLGSLGAGIKELGLKTASAAISIQLAKKNLGNISGIGAGIALVALGTIISAAANRLKNASFASGVRSFGGGQALVGERGPEMVYLPQGSSVKPHNELKAFGSSGHQERLVAVVSGQDLAFILTRANKTMQSNFGV